MSVVCVIFLYDIYFNLRVYPKKRARNKLLEHNPPVPPIKKQNMAMMS